MKNIKFDDLVGQELDFYGVDNHYFKLDNYVFEAIEDESDGYRSMLQDILLRDNIDDLIFFKTPITRIKVQEHNGGFDKNKGIHGNFRGYILVDIKYDHSWLTFGTVDYDDYYPMFIWHYQTIDEAMLEKLES